MVITAELNGLFIPDYPIAGEPFEPDSHDDFGIDVVAFIGAVRNR